eukprot:4416324-Pyramimonas_sp.AAC.2
MPVKEAARGSLTCKAIGRGNPALLKLPLLRPLSSNRGTPKVTALLPVEGSLAEKVLQVPTSDALAKLGAPQMLSDLMIYPATNRTPAALHEDPGANIFQLNNRAFR